MLRETAGSAAAMVVGWDVDGWKTAINDVLLDHARRVVMTQEGKKRASTMTWSDFAKKLEHHFVALTSAGPSSKK